MINRQNKLINGFIAASRIFTSNRFSSSLDGTNSFLVPTKQTTRAMENYLAIPTFIRQGRSLKKWL